jgi:hypothetical protein
VDNVKDVLKLFRAPADAIKPVLLRTYVFDEVREGEWP